MNTKTIIDFLERQFITRDNKFFKNEAKITYDSGEDVQVVGYATNLTPEVIESAKDNGVQLIITHHDAWEFIFGLKQKCQKMLSEYRISHYYNHLPLDDAEFGTNSSLAKKLGFIEVKKVNDDDGFKCGVIAENKHEYSFEEIVDNIESLLEEKVMSWKFNSRPVKRIHILCGAGHLTSDMQICVEEGCDLYITGEKILYSVEYAKLHDINLIVGSHTFIENFGVESLAMKIKDKFEELEVVRLNECHIEAEGMA